MVLVNRAPANIFRLAVVRQEFLVDIDDTLTSKIDGTAQRRELVNCLWPSFLIMCTCVSNIGIYFNNGDRNYAIFSDILPFSKLYCRVKR